MQFRSVALKLLLACTMLILPAVHVQAGQDNPTNTAGSPPLTLAGAIAIARERSALLKSLAADGDSALARARAAKALPDPVLKLGLANWPISGPARFKLDEQLPTAVASESRAN